MYLCRDCRGTGIKPEPMQAELFDHTFGRFCSCPIGYSKWQHILNSISSSETGGARPRPSSSNAVAKPHAGSIIMD